MGPWCREGGWRRDARKVVLASALIAFLILSLSYRLVTSQTPTSPFSLFSSPPDISFHECIGGELVVVSAASSNYFDRLENLIGSVHYWEPNLKIVIYDLGLSPDQVKLVKRMNNTEYRKFESQKYGGRYMKQLHFFAWKPLIINEVLQSFPMVLWQDAGMEFRAPISEIKESILSVGYFFDQSDSNFNSFAPQEMYDALGSSNDRLKYEGLPGLHAAVLGFCHGTRAHKQVLHPVAECCLNEECISPLGTDLENYRYDQSIFSFYLHKNGPFVIRKEPKFTACTLGVCPEFQDVAEKDDPDFQIQNSTIILFSRRWYPVKPYKSKVRLRSLTGEEQNAETVERTQLAQLKKRTDELEKNISQSVAVLTYPKDALMESLMQKNRMILDNLPNWNNGGMATENGYGKLLGNHTTSSDALTYIVLAFMGEWSLQYLELGGFVGKTLVQMAGSVENSSLTLVEAQEINSLLKNVLFNETLVDSWRNYWGRPSKLNHTFTVYQSGIFRQTRQNKVGYIRGHTRDENSYLPLYNENRKFNIIFTSLTQERNIRREMELILQYDLIEPTKFLIWFDGLSGDVTPEFVRIFLALKQRFPFLDEGKNVALAWVRGVAGRNAFFQLHGLISSMNVNEMLGNMSATYVSRGFALEELKRLANS